MTKVVLLKLRVAVASDFATPHGEKKVNVPYFCRNSQGIIENRLCFFTDDTDLLNFKILYANNQIFVFDDQQEPRNHNCIDWELIDKELDFEINMHNKFYPQNQIQ